MDHDADMLMQTLVDSGIVSRDDLESWQAATAAGEHPPSTDFSGLGSAAVSGSTPSGGGGPSGAEVIDRLRQAGRLTDFQAKVLGDRGASGLVLGDYVLLDRLGAGGMGEVFRAEHRVMRREVAIKRLATTAVGVPGLAERFMREVRTAAKLSHPNIVSAYDAGEDASGCYLVMEYVRGRDLSGLVKARGRLGVNQATDYLLQAARAVAFAHEAGVVHRDIKPANLMVDQAGTVKLLDLGLARVEATLAEHEHSQGLTLTDPGKMMGTLAYMAPEQAEDPHAAGPAADLYALGCTFCHMVSGFPPFVASTPTQALLAHRDSPPPDLGHVLPTPLHELYRSLLAKSPGDRPGSARAVVDELEALIATGVVERWRHRPEATDPAYDDLAASQRPTAALHAHAHGPVPTARRRRVDRPGARKPSNNTRTLMIAAGGGLALLVLVGVIAVVAFSGAPTGPTPDPDTAPGTTPGSNTLPTGTLLAGADTGVTGRPAEAARPAAAPDVSTDLLLTNTQAAAALQRDQAAAYELPLQITAGPAMTFRYIPAARSFRGSTPEQIEWARKEASATGYLDRYGTQIDSESPQTISSFARPYYMASTETTVAQFRAFVIATGYQTTAQTNDAGGDNFATSEIERDANWMNPGFEQTETNPAVNLTLADALAYCEWLGETTGLAFRLPTEGHWEHACRAGSAGRWCFGDDLGEFNSYGWSYLTSPRSTRPVAELLPNAFGLYDVHGNAREWCLFNDGSKTTDLGFGVVRGGSFTKPAVLLRCASRVGFRAETPYSYHGFRVMLELSEQTDLDKVRALASE